MDERIMEQIREDNATRLRRSDAWIKKAKSVEDAASKFIFYWIAFNAQYSSLINAKEQKERNDFLDKIYKDEKGKRELEIIFNKNESAIKRIFKLPQTHRDFWKKPKGQQIENIEQWQQYFKKNGSLPEDKEKKLKDLFSRLSVVRNQIFHGSHSGNEHSYGYTQVEEGVEMLSELIPCFFDIIQSSVKENSCTDSWGKVIYRREGSPDDVNCPPPWLLEGKK